MEVTIPRSNGKSLRLVLGGVALTGLGAWLMTVGDPISFVVGLVQVVFFGPATAAAAWPAVRPHSGLRIDDEGFDDRTALVSVGRVPWSEVTAIHTQDVHSFSFVIVDVRDPFTYVDRVPWFSRGALRRTITRTGTSVTLSSTTLQTSHSELCTVLTEAYERFHARGRDTGR